MSFAHSFTPAVYVRKNSLEDPNLTSVRPSQLVAPKYVHNFAQVVAHNISASSAADPGAAAASRFGKTALDADLYCVRCGESRHDAYVICASCTGAGFAFNRGWRPIFPTSNGKATALAHVREFWRMG
jgi:ribosomal protein L37E